MSEKCKPMAVVIVGDDKDVAAAMAGAVQYGLECFGFTDIQPTQKVQDSKHFTMAEESAEIENILDALYVSRPGLFDTKIVVDIAKGSVSTRQEEQIDYRFSSSALVMDTYSKTTENRDVYPAEKPEALYGHVLGLDDYALARGMRHCH